MTRAKLSCKFQIIVTSIRATHSELYQQPRIEIYGHSPRTNLFAILAHFSISGPDFITVAPTFGHQSGNFACEYLLQTSFAGSGTRLIRAASIGDDDTATTTSFPPRLRSLLSTTALPPSPPPHNPLPNPRRHQARKTIPSSTRAATAQASKKRSAPAK